MRRKQPLEVRLTYIRSSQRFKAAYEGTGTELSRVYSVSSSNGGIATKFFDQPPAGFASGAQWVIWWSAHGAA